MTATHVLSQNTRVYVDGYDISGDASSAESNLTAVMGDDTTFLSTGRTHQKGILDDHFIYEGFFDDSAAGVDVIFSALRARSYTSGYSDIFSMYPDLDTVGKPGKAGLIDNSRYSAPVKVADLVTVKAEFGVEGGIMPIKSLGAQATITGTTTGTTVDDSASSALGGTWLFHIFAISCVGGNARAVFTLQDSANGTDWLTVGTESYNVSGAVPTQGIHNFTGTLRRYVRLLVTKDCTTMSLTYQAGYHRGQNGPTN